MKLNKFTSALIGLGIVSLAGAAHAATIVYLTGSTAARGNIFTAATTAGQIFTAGGTIDSPAPNNTSSANTIVFEGNVAGVGDVILDCTFTGSEAGIASTAGKPLVQTIPADPNGPGPYALPGVPPAFLTQVSGWTTTSVLPIAGDGRAVTVPDFTMADTSQAVSQTPAPVLLDYGIVGIVPFTFMKGYESAPDATYGRVLNVTTAAVNQNLAAGAALFASMYTGNAADNAEPIVIMGRNLGSGTRVNTLLNAAAYPVNGGVDQFALNSSYPAATPGVLTFSGVYGPPAAVTPLEVFNDGFDSGSGVQKCLNTDGSGQGAVFVGYAGLSDARHAFLDDNTGPGGTGSAVNSGTAVYLTFNGVYESDSAVELGQYPYWGSEHLLGTPGQGAPETTVGDAIVTGLNVQTAGLGSAAGNVTTAAQSTLIPVPKMQVHRSLDFGYPVQGSWPTPYQFTH
jgi:hypothetical protein